MYRLNCPMALHSQMDDLIDDIANTYLEQCAHIKAFDSFEVGVKSADYSYYIGMIWTNGEAKVDPRYLMVRGSTSLTNNSRVILDISNVTQEFSLFPGQIIAFKAKPHEDARLHILVVSEILDPMNVIKPRPEPFTLDKSEKIVVAAGPYTKSTDSMVELDYSLLKEMLQHCKKIEPTRLVLLGPFVMPTDDDDKLMETSINATRELNERFLRYIKNELKDSSCSVYLVPSPHELMDSPICTYIYPTPTIEITPDKKSKLKVHCLSDPAKFNFKNIIVQATSVDALFHLGQSEVTINRNSTDRMQLLARHLVTQNSIFPVYPIIQKVDEQSVLRDHINIEHCRLMKQARHSKLPHIMIVSSRFMPFAKNVHGCLVINPAACTRKSYVHIEIPNSKEYSSETFAESVEVNIVKFLTSPVVIESTSEPSTQEFVPTPPMEIDMEI